jgi:hypothetical protein
LPLDRHLPLFVVVKNQRTPLRTCVFLFLAIVLLPPRPGLAQDAPPPSLLPGWITPTPKGLLPDAALLRQIVATSENRANDEREPDDGLYVETGNMITGEGWISAGSGYRRHVLDDRLLVDVSTAVSWNLYNLAQASVEVSRLAHDRVTVVAQLMYQDFLQVEYFGLGNGSREADQSGYRFKNTDVVGCATVKATRWLSVSGHVGDILRPRLLAAARPRVLCPSTVDLFSEASAPGILGPPSFVHADVPVAADLRDHKGHPTGGGLYQFVAARCWGAQ